MKFLHYFSVLWSSLVSTKKKTQRKKKRKKEKRKGKKEENSKNTKRKWLCKQNVSTTSFDIAWTAPKVFATHLFIYLLPNYFRHFPHDHQASKRYKYPSSLSRAPTHTLTLPFPLHEALA
jgi:hypothetical protein